MTREEEAIKILTQYIDYDAETPDYYEMEKACKVAIEALSAIEDIKAEIEKNRDRDISGSGNIVDWLDGYRTAFNETLVIIDNYINGKE